jgi:hypothetical protein
MLMTGILATAARPLRGLHDTGIAYSLRTAQVDTAYKAFSFDPTEAGPRGEATKAAPLPSPVPQEG